MTALTTEDKTFLDTVNHCVEDISNHSGDLHIGTINNKFYCSMLDWDGFEWREIPHSLYVALKKFADK